MQGHTGKLLADGGTTAAVAAVPLLEGAATMTAGLGRSGSSAGPQTLDLLGPGGTTALLGPLGGESQDARLPCGCRLQNLWYRKT